jgi:hypothetical protein
VKWDHHGERQRRCNLANYKPLGLEDLMPFGKFKGTKIRVLLYEDIAYVNWAITNANLQLDNKAFEKFQELIANIGE